MSGLVNVDLTPEVAVRLAAALGTALKRGARVVASRESAPACRMIKRAMISGFTSAGLDVGDLRVLPAAVARHMLKSEGYEAGFHVGTSQSDPEVVQIRFFEQPGIQLSPAMQKEIEKNFTRGELRRAAFGDIGGNRCDRLADDLVGELFEDASSDTIDEVVGNHKLAARRRTRRLR